MKKILLSAILIMGLNPAYSRVEETFQGMDIQSLKSGASKYIILHEGKVYHPQDYRANNFKAVEQKGNTVYYYDFQFFETPDGSKISVDILKSTYGSAPKNLDEASQRQILEQIKSSIKGRYLYGLGFEFQMYDSPNGKIKAPKGKETGIVLTAVKYDAKNKGLMAGDVIVEINGMKTSDIPLEKFANILFAQNMQDSLALTYKRNGSLLTVTLIPRPSGNKVF